MVGFYHSLTTCTSCLCLLNGKSIKFCCCYCNHIITLAEPHNNEIPFNTSLLPHTDCVLYAVGKPVYHKFSEQNYGAWLKDPLARSEAVTERIWATKENDNLQLFEYANKITYRNNAPSKIYRLQFPFKVLS